MEIDKLSEILRLYTDKLKYNSGFASYKRNYVSNDYVNTRGHETTFYATVFDEHHRRSYTSMISINTKSRTVSNLSCDCQNVFNNKGTQVCSHMVASVLEGIKKLRDKTKEEFSEGDIILNPTVIFDLSQSRGGNLGASLHIDKIDKNEYDNIYNSYKNKYKYHLMPDGSYIDLKDNDLEKIFQIIDVLDIYSDFQKIKIPDNKAVFLEKLLEDESNNLISGRKYVDNVIKKYNKLNKNIKVPENLNANLRDYQVDGFEFFNTLSNYNFGGILADEMGLGKTVQTLAFLLSQKDKKSIVITPTSLIYNWENEFEKFTPDIKLGIAYGNKVQREKVLENYKDYDVILTSYGTYKNDMEKYKNITFDYCIIDEAQNIKNPDSIITKSVKEVNANVKFALTGTPVENNLMELWSIFDFVMPGYLYSKKKFETIFVNNEKNHCQLKNLIKPFMLRRTKKEVINELPDKIEHKFYVELDKEHKRAYRSFVNLIKRRILENNEDNMTVFSYLTKLRQLSIAPEIIVKNYKGKNSKLEILINIIKEEDDRKILVFSQFTKVLQVIEKRLVEENISYSYLDGKTDAKDRMRLVEEFNNSDTKKVFLISLKAGGTGLNLTSASMVVHFDPWFNPASENQASDRAHRIGQKNVVDVIKLISKGTVEEKVIAMQDYKKELIEDIINSNLENSSSLKKLTREEIIDLFESI
ncbi:DEAD/DEAH box helicase [Terrisporobacter petrolearius]|uniref:DEAD/DEAH box helicase n=1 Tax=Terrisporobacter petrolearius TaxID=1460447 RepID=UPI001D1604D2|nr:DEAD/DEAH box helicase [Terrisporobacter petrolearius]MCC3863222.1 DEAD/DEAH box helicase [Terrisporobacter petrolearius]